MSGRHDDPDVMAAAAQVAAVKPEFMVTDTEKTAMFVVGAKLATGEDIALYLTRESASMLGTWLVGATKNGASS